MTAIPDTRALMGPGGSRDPDTPGFRVHPGKTTKPYEFIWFGAMDITKPYEIRRVWGHSVLRGASKGRGPDPLGPWTWASPTEPLGSQPLGRPKLGT